MIPSSAELTDLPCASSASERATAADVACAPLVLTAQGTGVRSVVDAALGAAGCAPDIACEPAYRMTSVGWCTAGSA